jgi:hypothetical protein
MIQCLCTIFLHSEAKNKVFVKRVQSNIYIISCLLPFHTEYTECQAFFPIVRIGSPHPLNHKRVLLPLLGPRGETNSLGGGGEGGGGPTTMGHSGTLASLQRHNKENSRQIFPKKELRGLSPGFHIHVSVSDLYISVIGLPILLQENMWTDPGNINRSQTHEYGNWN